MAVRTQPFEPRQSMSRSTFEIFHYREAKPQSVRLHHHDFYEIYFFLGGDVNYLIDGNKHKLQKGDLLLISPMELHHPMPHAGSPYERMVLWIDRQYLASLSPAGLNLSECFRSGSHTRVNILHSNAMMQGHLAELFEHLNQEMYHGEWGHEAYAESLLIQLLLEINRMVRQKSNSPAATEEVSLANRVTSYINRHYYEDLSLDTLAKKFFVSKYYLSHEFSQQVGVGVYRYLTLKRLSIAKELLADGKAAGEVATACGFHNYTTFYRIFKAEYGTSPSSFADAFKPEPRSQLK